MSSAEQSYVYFHLKCLWANVQLQGRRNVTKSERRVKLRYPQEENLTHLRCRSTQLCAPLVMVNRLPR